MLVYFYLDMKYKKKKNQTVLIYSFFPPLSQIMFLYLYAMYFINRDNECIKVIFHHFVSCWNKGEILTIIGEIGKSLVYVKLWMT